MKSIARIQNGDATNAQQMDGSDPFGHILLASFQQSQQHQITAEVRGGEVQYLHGPVDQVRWSELHIVLDALQTAVVRTGLAQPESLKCKPYFVTTAAGWNPGLRLWVDTSQNQSVDTQKIRTVIEAVLVGLKRDSIDDAGDFSMLDFSMLDISPIEREATCQVIRETLKITGGKRLAQPVDVVNGESLLRLEGKLGAKPSQANFHPIVKVVAGQFTGFDLQKKELLFSTLEKCLHINFNPQDVDLVAVTHAAIDGRSCELRTHQTTARNGHYDYAYLPDSPFKV